MKWNRIARSTHQGLGLLVGIQVLLWISGGFVMSAFPIHKVRGEDWMQEAATRTVGLDETLASPLEAARSAGWGALERAELVDWQGQPVYRLHSGNETLLAEARTGKILSPLTESWAKTVAEADYAGPGSFASIRLQSEPEAEIRGRDLPLWRAEFDDSRHTTLYISPQSGRVVARRNDIWRVYDFFWMLHIMDYSERDNFNHPLLVTAAVVAWLLATSGLWLVVTWLMRRKRRTR